MASLLVFIFFIIGFVLGSIKIVSSEIKIIPTFATFEVIKKKTLCCFNKRETILINNLKNVIIKFDPINRFRVKRNYIPAFEVTFVLVDGSEVEALSGVINVGRESKKVFNFLRNSLPERISFSGNLIGS